MKKKKQIDEYIKERDKIWKDFKKVWLGGFIVISLISLFLAIVKNTGGFPLFVAWIIPQIALVILVFYFHRKELKKIEYLKIDINKYVKKHPAEVEKKKEQQEKELKQL